MRRIFIAVGLFALLLAGCASVPEPTPLPTVTGTVTLTPTRFKVVVPTQVMYPTRTPFLSPTPTLTNSPQPTITLPPYPTPGVIFLWAPESISPSGKWIVWQVECSAENAYLCLQLISKDGSQIWSLTDEDFTEVPYLFYFRIAHWSGDNKFVYFVTSVVDLDAYYEMVPSIAKFSLVNGSLSYIITPDETSDESEDIEWPILYTYDFSTNSQWLVYAIHSGRSINFVLLDLYSGDSKYFSVIVEEDSYSGDIAWSPDDRFFVFSVDEDTEYLGESDDYSIFLVTREDLSIKRVYPHGYKMLFYPEWISDREVRYEYWENGHRFMLILNIETGEVTEVEQ